MSDAMDRAAADWLAANQVMVKLLRECFGDRGTDEQYDRIAGAFQARLTYLDPPLVVARMDALKDSDE